MNHTTIWLAIRRLAKSRGLSCSGLARFSGLDSTTFNKSKEFNSDGTPRWPSCATIAKIIEATHISLGEFAQFLDPDNEN